MLLGLEVGSLADWVSGIGTIITIIASFYLYHSQEKARFNVSPISGRSSDRTKQPQSMLKIENIGHRPINIIYLGTSTQSKLELKFDYNFKMERSSTITNDMDVDKEGNAIDVFNLMGIQMSEMGVLPIIYKTDVLYDKAKKVSYNKNMRKTSMIFMDNAGYIYATKMFVTRVNENNQHEYFVEVSKTKKIKMNKFKKNISSFFVRS